MNDYEKKLLEGWEEVYKKGQLTLWIMLALKNGEKHMAEIKNFMENSTNNSLTADDKSMYRSLRRYYDVEMIDFTNQPSESGPDKKLYQLTDSGRKILERFIERNISSVFYKDQVIKLIKKEAK